MAKAEKNSLTIKHADCTGFVGAKNQAIYYLATEKHSDYIEAIFFIKDHDEMIQIKKDMVPLVGTEAQSVYLAAVFLFEDVRCDFCGRRVSALTCGTASGLIYCSVCAIKIKVPYEPLPIKKYLCERQ